VSSAYIKISDIIVFWHIINEANEKYRPQHRSLWDATENAAQAASDPATPTLFSASYKMSYPTKQFS